MEKISKAFLRINEIFLRILKAFLKKKELLVVILISLISTFVSGYQFAVSDQEIVIPYILKLQDATLFPDDLLFSQFSADASFFYQIMAFLTKSFGMETIFFLGYLTTKAFFFIGIYYLAKVFFKSKQIAFLSLLPFLMPKFIGGTATYTFDSFFGYRSVGVVFLVFYLSFLLKNQFIKSSFIAGIGLFFHPLSIIPSLLLAPVLIIKNSKKKTKDLLYFFIIITISVLLYILFFKVDSNIWSRSQEWLSIIKSRNGYIFPSTWGVLGWLSLCLYLTLIAFYLKFSNRRDKGDILTITIVSLFVLVVDFVILEFIKLPGFAKFQLVRSITPIALIGLVVSPHLLLFKDKHLKFIGLISFITLTLNLFYLFLVSTIILLIFILKVKKLYFSVSRRNSLMILYVIIVFAIIFNQVYLHNIIQYPKQANYWIDVQLWAKENTPKNAKFLVPPNQTGFRIFSHRAIVGDVKDGAVIIYGRQYAQDWYKITQVLQGYDNFDGEDFLEFRDKHNFDYVITRQNNLNQEKVFNSGENNVYKF